MITFDRAGRLYSAFLDGRFYRRGVDGRVVEKFRDHETVRSPLEPHEARGVAEKALGLARATPGGNRLGLIDDLEADAAQFRAAYDGPVAPLPPDRARAVVLQATVGCAYNACLYCSRYRDRTFRARDDADFERHLHGVVEAFGAGLSLRRGVFLGDADALFLDTEALLRFCARARQLRAAEDGIYCFGGLFGDPLRSRSAWERLRAAGIRRVYLALETGYDPMRQALNKPGTATDALRLVRGLKTAGIGVGLQFVLGANGGLANAHIRDSAALVRAAFLDEHDLVYLAPLVGPDGRVDEENFRAQEAAMRGAIGDGPSVAVYDVRGFVY